MPNLNNVLMQLRKLCNHPFLIEGAEDKWLTSDGALVSDTDAEPDPSVDAGSAKAKTEDEAEAEAGVAKARPSGEEAPPVGSDAATDAERPLPVMRLPVQCRHLVRSCGKMAVLSCLLRRMWRRRSKVLIFSQMVRMLDLLADFCEASGCALSFVVKYHM